MTIQQRIAIIRLTEECSPEFGFVSFSDGVQQRMQAKLESIGLPYKCIHCYGSQIVVTSWSRGAAEKWASVLKKFATLKCVVESLDYNDVNRNTVMKPTTHNVWRTYATI